MKNTNSFILFLSSLVILLVTLFTTPAYALISSISAPTTALHPGQKFVVTFHTVPYIQGNRQFYALFGVAPYPGLGESFLGLPVPAVGPTPGADGGAEGGMDLYKAGLSNEGLGQYHITLRLPKSLATVKTTKYTLQTGVLGNVGASGLTTLSFFNTTILVK